MPAIAPSPERSVAVLVRFQVDQPTRDAVIKLIRHLVGGGAVLRAAHRRFRGLLIRIELAGEAPDIYFARDRGGLANRLSEAFSPVRQGRERIEAGSPDFEALYETYASDPAAARRFITPRLTDGLLEIAQGETGRTRYVAAATRGRGFYLAIPRRDDFLALGSLFRPLTVAEDDFHQCLADLALPQRVIEALGPG